MLFYQEINLRPDNEVGLFFLWEKIYQQIHLGLVETQTNDGIVTLGLAFPGYQAKSTQLGNQLRIFAKASEQLEAFNVEVRLSRMYEYVDISAVNPVPEHIENHACFYRIQPKSNLERLARRKAKRQQISTEAALALLEGFNEQICNAPYIWIKSQSSGERFRLFIGRIDVSEPSYQGFTSYGLSRLSTVPIF